MKKIHHRGAKSAKIHKEKHRKKKTPQRHGDTEKEMKNLEFRMKNEKNSPQRRKEHKDSQSITITTQSNKYPLFHQLTVHHSPITTYSKVDYLIIT